MENLERTLKLVPLNLIESIVKNSDIFFKLIRTPNDSMFDEYEFHTIVKAINDYMNYCIKNSNTLTKDQFDRINYLNSFAKTNIKYDYEKYLDKTDKFVCIEYIEAILNEQEVFDKFINFEENKDYFDGNISQYLAELTDLISYYEKNQIEISSEQRTRFEQIMKTHSLDLKFYHQPEGYKYDGDLNEELMNKVLSNVDLTEDKFTIARAIYIELCKNVRYDVEFEALKQDISNPEANEIYERDLKQISVHDNRVICKTWAEIYQKLLERVNINAVINEDFHRYVTFDCDGTLIKADATNSFSINGTNMYMDDIARVQLGIETGGFTCLEQYKDIKIPLQIADEKIEYHKSTIEEKFKTIENSYCTVMPVLQDKESIIKEKITMLKSILDKTSMTGFELNAYGAILKKIIFKDLDVECRHICTKNEDEQFDSAFVFSILIDGDYNYIIYQKNTDMKLLTKEELLNIIESNKVILVGKNNSIPGISEVENEYSETSRNK